MLVYSENCAQPPQRQLVFFLSTVNCHYYMRDFFLGWAKICGGGGSVQVLLSLARQKKKEKKESEREQIEGSKNEAK